MDDLTQREFLAELEELIEQLFAATEELRQETSKLRQRDLLAKTFRCLHSIKGLAASADFGAMADLAHLTETALDAAQSGRIEISTAFIDALEDAANALSESLGQVANERLEPPNGSLLERLRTLAASADDSSGSIRLPELPAHIADSLNEREKQLVLRSLRAYERLCLVAADFDLAIFDTRFQKLREALARYGEVVCTLPSAEGPAPNRIGFRLFFTSKLSAAELQGRLASIPEAIVTAVAVAAPMDSQKEVQRVPAAKNDSELPLPASFIRLELEELDRLLASAHEVFAQIVAALDFVSHNLSGDAQTELSNLDAQVRQSLTALEEKIVELRTTSVDRVFQRAVRAGRVAARSAGKEVNFILGGSDLRIDKVSSDAIGSPLVNLVRNAVDHGIETPAERTKSGKKASGTVRIEASATGDVFRFVVADDGRGIDPQVITLAAATRGLIEKDMVLDMDQSLRLIFHPGFSTAKTVSNLSGRGVGLDVVGVSVERVGGSVGVQTWPGKGSEFELRLPNNSAKS